jgi:predicted ATPase/GAF domain-containing protein/tRNA A-37 threonylcarbamoyl transferase component Bud32
MMSASAHSEYTATATLHQGCTTLYRAIRGDDRCPVVLKVLDARRCHRKDLERLRREYEMGVSLDLPTVVRPLALETYHGMPALVLEDFGGEPLDRLLGAPMPVERFLELAVRIAGAVGDLHRQGVIHKDLKPESILVHESTLEVKLTDFGIATRLPREQQAARPPQLIEGSLPYMSPEQTGRMNRTLDSRSDLYSLGITFHQMLTGRLPFEARDPLEWVHCHVARVPAPPSQLMPEVPEAIAQIVMKLLAKMADDRYQTARGLEHDLARCLEQSRDNGRIDPFPLGERDVPDRIQITQKLHGREEEIATLLRAFERVVDTGTPELLLVSGYSGIGKSSLVHELEKPIVGRRGLFVAGKFDQYKRDIPYSTIAQAFRDLVLDLLVEGEERITAWRQRLQSAVGKSGQLIVDMIPQVELLVGKQPAVSELPIGEAQKRFHMVFRQFLGVFTHKEHPLTLFLDDLQWADSASLELLAEVLTHPETRHLLAVGAYRDNEVTPGHPLMMTLDRARKADLPVRDLVLTPLSREHLGRLVADAMRRPAEEVEPLALLVGEKTAGNPFFAIQFLISLHDDGLIRLDPQTLAWRCDIDAARARGYTDNVAELMVGKLRRLPAEAQEALRIAACAGNVVDGSTLAVLRERSEEETHRDVWDLVRDGLLHRSGDTYRFSHDRVQQAAYALIPEERRSETHLRIGRLLLAHTPAEKLSERVFDIVNQLNRGASLIEDQEERYRVAELDLLAGQRARASTAYGPAAKYLAAGMPMLPVRAWQERYELTFALHLERARCEYLIGRFAEAERHVALALLNARTLAEKATCYRLRIEVYAINGQVEKAIDSVVECAALFGREFDRHPPAESVKEQYESVMGSLGGRSIEELIDLPPTSDPDFRALAEALVAAIPIAYQHDLCLPFAITSEVVRLSIEHGNAPCSAHAYALFGMLVGPFLGNYRLAYRFGKLGHDLVERGGLLAYKAGNGVCFGYYTLFWTRHVSMALTYLEAGRRAGAETGDLRDACYCCTNIVSVLLARGDSLDEVERQSAEMLGFVRNAKLGYMEDVILTQRRLVHRLRGPTSSPASASSQPGEDEGLDTRIQSRVPLAVCVYYIRRLQERFLFGEYREAFSAAVQAKDMLWTSVSSWERCEHSYFLALTLAAIHADASSHDREEHLHTLRVEAEQHRVWAQNCPENFGNRAALVAAEIARIDGDADKAGHLYEEAIRSARENGFVQNEAIAFELASKFYRGRGFDLIADSYLCEARACYLRWGAEGKVKQLDELHPQLLERRPLTPAATFAARTEQLDLFSVVKASQTISGEMEIEKLVGTLLQVVLEQGGARTGHLILARDGALSIEAEASLREKGVATRILPSQAVESSRLLPVSVIHYARLTREPVILDDAAAHLGKFDSDAYFADHHPRSVLCLPIVRHDLVGLLYLENDLVAGAFTPERLTVLTLLASQAAISMDLAQELAHRAAIAIDNARLYREAQEAIHLRDATLRELEELKTQLEEENLYLREEIDADLGAGGMVGESDALKYVLLRIRQVASSAATVLIEGETGVGKELVARAIHDASDRAKGPFVRVNCAALPAQIVESELFGHEAGAFTGAMRLRKGRFELADGGTLFLDEIGEMPLELQAKLLRVLQEGELERVGGTRTLRVDVRVIAAANRGLRGEVAAGRFREDLFYRLNVFPLTVPPLRARRDDIPLLVRYFVPKLAAGAARRIREIPGPFVRALVEHDWPGNVRELRNVLERAVLQCTDGVLRLPEPLEPRAGRRGPAQAGEEDAAPAADATLHAVERQHIVATLRRTRGKVSGPAGAAILLGMNANTLRSRMKKLGIQVDRTLG